LKIRFDGGVGGGLLREKMNQLSSAVTRGEGEKRLIDVPHKRGTTAKGKRGIGNNLLCP